MRQFNPFSRSFEDLDITDLESLRSVHESWYVDYKLSIIEPKKIAKALSAFANTYGGWIFFGVEECDEKEPVAKAFPGIPSEEVSVAMQKIRQSADQHLQPTPHFEIKILNGPCKEVGLEEERTILAIYVARSFQAPHIHSDGRIYQRVSDGSEPKAINDRFIVDQLSSRGDSQRQLIKEWIERDPELSRGEEETPFLKLFLSVDPWGEAASWLSARACDIRAVLTSAEDNMPSIKFDSVYPVTGGMMARQIGQNNPHDMSLSLKLTRSLNCEVIIPLKLYEHGQPESLKSNLDGYNQCDRFISLLSMRNHQNVRIVDLNIATNLLSAIVAKYRRLLKLAGAPSTFYLKVRVLNAWRTIPFLDVEAILEEYVTSGIPMMMQSEAVIPPGYSPDSFAEICENHSAPEAESESVGDIVDYLVQGYIVFTHVATAFGVPILLEGENEEDDSPIEYGELKNAGLRAMSVQND